MLLGFTQWPNLIDNRIKDVIWSLWTSLSIHINIDSCWFGFCSNGGMTSNLILKKRLSIVVAKKSFVLDINEQNNAKCEQNIINSNIHGKIKMK